MIPFLDVSAGYRELKSELDGAFRHVMERGLFVLGPELEAFEDEFAAYSGVRHCVGVGTGLDALFLILRALGVGRGDEVVVPANTFIATWLSVSMAGATPVAAEVDPETFNVGPKEVERVLGPRTRAVIAVHLYGRPADVPGIAHVCRPRGIAVVEDAAQAHGARWIDRSTGSLGLAAGWSFYPGKNLGAFGDGGAVTTDDAELAAKIRSLRNYGSRVKYHHDVAGVNTRLDEVQAAFLRVKLRYLDAWNERRRAVASLYLRELAGTPDILLPSSRERELHAWHLFVVRHGKRDELREYLEGRGVQTLIHYPVPPADEGAYRGTVPGATEHTRLLAAEVLSLPIGPHLSLDDAAIVAREVDFGCRRLSSKRLD